MSLNSTPSAERIHIGVFGKRNAGKSSVVNAITSQQVSLVSDVKGTTTDPVKKAMEILPLGAVEIIDTAGFDDVGYLGELRIKRTKEVLKNVDIAILVIDATIGISKQDTDFINIFKENNLKYLIVYNKIDLLPDFATNSTNEIAISVKNNFNIDKLKNLIADLNPKDIKNNVLIRDMINENETVILVTPIDSSAPKGRLILPQQQVIRDLLEAKAITLVVQETELENALNNLKHPPKLVITDSQVFNKVAQIVPKNIFLTSFSILFSRYKGVLNIAVNGAAKIEHLEDGDTVLISEGCTHHRQCEDIGTVKLPNLIKKYTNKNLNFEFSSGNDFPSDLTKYSLIIHCGGCTLKETEVLNRYKKAQLQQIPITNYGIAIAYMNNILKRTVEIFPEVNSLF